MKELCEIAEINDLADQELQRALMNRWLLYEIEFSEISRPIELLILNYN